MAENGKSSKNSETIDRLMEQIEAGDEKTIKGLERFLDIMLNPEKYEE